MNRRIIACLMILVFVISLAGYNKDCSVVMAEGDTSSSSYPSAADIAGNATTTDAGFIPADAPEINAQSAIVMDIDTGDILYEKAAHQAQYPASITKVLTCLLAVQNGNVNDTLTISQSCMNQVEEGSSSIGLQVGEQLTLKDALYGMMLNSGNECALSIAEYISGSTEKFAELMNKTAKDLGCMDSNFVNPNGLHDPNHYTTCYDMALIGRAAYQYPEFKTLISSQSYTIPETNMNVERPLWQENRLIYSGNGEYYYEYSTGGKTGYTEAALATLISFAERDGKRLVTVVMRCNPTTDSYLDTKKLCEFCFSHYRLCKPLLDYSFISENTDNSDVLSNYYNDINHPNLKYYVNTDYSFCIRSYIDDTEIQRNVTYYSDLSDNKRGKITFTYNGLTIGETEILADKPYIAASSTDAILEERNTPAPTSNHLIWVKRIIVAAIILIIILLLIIIIVKLRKRIQYYNSKRTVKYYPISKDARLNKKKEEEQKKLEEKEKKKAQASKKSDDNNDDNSDNSLNNGLDNSIDSSLDNSTEKIIEKYLVNNEEKSIDNNIENNIDKSLDQNIVEKPDVNDKYTNSEND